MSGLAYVGATATNPKDITNRLAVITAINTTAPNQSTVQNQVNNLVSGGSPTYATKSYVDTQDATFQLPAYYQSQDALNIALSSKGQSNGVASLDSSALVPLAQLPVMGVGYLQGPWGVTATATGTTAGTPLRIADWNIGAAGLNFRPLVFLNAFILGSNAHPIIEVRIADSTTAPTYASMTTVGMSLGRQLYNDYHAVSTIPVGDTTAETPSNLGTSYNVWLTAWLYDLNASSVTISAGGVVSGAAYLLRGAL